MARESAAEAIDVRRSDAGIEAEASCPTMPNAPRNGTFSARETPVTIMGASAENPTTMSSTAM